MMIFIGFPNIGFGDTLPWLVPVSGILFGLLAYWKTEREKHKMTTDAEVEKHRISKQAEVDKEKEHSVGGEAVIVMWKEFKKVQDEINKLAEWKTADQTDKLLMMEIIKRLQEDIARLMDAFFENLPKKHT